MDGMAWPNRSLDIAIVGSGISGLSAAWLLSKRHRVTLYEKEPRHGGHANTIDVAGADGRFPVDTGFMVYNEVTYPNLTALFAHLGVTTGSTDMSLSVSLDRGRLEYAATDLSTLFAQKRNLISPRFWSMLWDLLRFYRQAPRNAGIAGSLGDYLDRHGYGEAFQRDHLLPMAAAIWSAPPDQLREYSARAFIRFCENHGLLSAFRRPIWRTVSGGSRAYVRKMTGAIGPHSRVDARVSRVFRGPHGVSIRLDNGETIGHDHVVLACHANQALALLDSPSAEESLLLGSFCYSRNRITLHGDAAFMPKRRAVWSSWNYLGRPDTGEPVHVTYWMNRLQNLPTTNNVFVTLNAPRDPDPRLVFHTEECSHPRLDEASMAAQESLWSLQGHRRTWFCGAWFGAGFHEDGLQAGLAVAEQLGRVRRPWSVLDENDRIHVTEPAMWSLAA